MCQFSNSTLTHYPLVFNEWKKNRVEYSDKKVTLWNMKTGVRLFDPLNINDLNHSNDSDFIQWILPIDEELDIEEEYTKPIPVKKYVFEIMDLNTGEIFESEDIMNLNLNKYRVIKRIELQVKNTGSL